MARTSDATMIKQDFKSNKENSVSPVSIKLIFGEPKENIIKEKKKGYIKYIFNLNLFPLINSHLFCQGIWCLRMGSK